VTDPPQLRPASTGRQSGVSTSTGRESRGCSFGLVPVLVRVRRLRGKQRTPPATVYSTPHARGGTRRRFPLRARPRRVLSGDGRRRTAGRSPAGTWTRCQRWSPSGPRIAGRGSAASAQFLQSEDEEWAGPWRPRAFPDSTCQIHRGLDARGSVNREAEEQASASNHSRHALGCSFGDSRGRSPRLQRATTISRQNPSTLREPQPCASLHVESATRGAPSVPCCPEAWRQALAGSWLRGRATRRAPAQGLGVRSWERACGK
jgi:hypothetical protein